MHNEPCSCGHSRPWLTLEGRTDDVLTFKNGVRIAPLSLYAILKEVHGIERFQLVQHEQDRLELRLVAVDREKFFFEAKQAVEKYLKKNKVSAEVYLILSRLVDTFSSRILYPMLLLSGNHSIAVA